MKIDDLLQKSADNGAFSRQELVHMLRYAPNAPETYRILAEANRISRELTGNRAEVQGQLALNLAPCACNCKFCSFSAESKIFSKATEISALEAVAQARLFEENGANAIYVMTTAFYPLEKFLDISKEVRRNLKKETVMIANVGDKTLEQARQIKDAGYKGVYHALRMREGVDTDLDPEQRRISIRNFQEAGLSVGTCVEPVGPEHTNEEIADRILFTASIHPAFSGAARRITIPGGPMESLGMISELRMAQIVAVTRLAMPRTTLGNCTHEPCTLGALAGANLFWAEVGANPRDIEEKTEQGRGDTVDHCRKIYEEAGWEVHTGPSRYF